MPARELIDRAFRAASDEAGVGHRPGVEDDRAIPHDKLAVGPAGSLGGWRADLRRGCRDH
jgi:hypothetical protein